MIDISDDIAGYNKQDVMKVLKEKINTKDKEGITVQDNYDYKLKKI